MENNEKPMILETMPDDLIVDIMTRVPPKSVVRFRCLSKSWNSCLRSPQFIRTHLNKAKGTQQFILCARYDLQKMSMESYPKAASDLYFPVRFQWKLWKRYHGFRPLGSSNGLFCVALDTEIIIVWNPSIFEFKILPLPDKVPVCEYSEAFGFGYDKSRDDYKLVRFFQFHPTATNLLEHALYLDIYSLKSNSWRRIRSPIIDIRFPDFYREAGGIEYGGFLHWFVRCEADCRILRFDLASERLVITTPPNQIAQSSYDRVALRLVGGCLTLTKHFRRKSDIELWKLEKDETKESWILFMRITHNQILPETYYWTAECILENGEILFTYMKNNMRRFTLYDPVTDIFRSLEVNDMRQWCNSVTYMKSLVSPNSYSF